MSDDGDDYHDHQQKWEDLRDWGEQHPEEWEEDELLKNEELLYEIEAQAESSLLFVVHIKAVPLFHTPSLLASSAPSAKVSAKLAVSRTYLADIISFVAVSVKAERALEKSTVIMLTRGTMTASRSSRTPHRP